MSYETRAYDNEHGDPVVVIVATGTHDVSRLVNLLNGATPNSEQRRLATQVTRQAKRHNGGRDALRLLAQHGGPDLLTEVGTTPPMFDVKATLPDVREGEPVTAENLARWFAGSAMRHMAIAHRNFPYDDRTREAMNRWQLRLSEALGRFAITSLLRDLMEHAPDAADAVADRLWAEMCGGEASEVLADWLAKWGLDTDDIITKAYADARTADLEIGVATPEEMALRAWVASFDAKYGHPEREDGTSAAAAAYGPIAQNLTRLNEANDKGGRLTWQQILWERLAWVKASDTTQELQANLTRLIAAATVWRRRVDQRLTQEAEAAWKAAQEEADRNRPELPCPEWSREVPHDAHNWDASTDGPARCPGYHEQPDAETEPANA